MPTRMDADDDIAHLVQLPPEQRTKILLEHMRMCEHFDCNLCSMLRKRMQAANEENDEMEERREEEQRSAVDCWFETLEAAVRALNAKGHILIRGIPQGDAGDDAVSRTEVTDKDMARMRVVVITEEREEAMLEMRDELLGPKHDTYYSLAAHLTTICDMSLALKMLEVGTALVVELRSETLWARLFDRLFAYSNTINDVDSWVHAHPQGWAFSGGKELLDALADAWRQTLAQDDATLGIDGTYTRAGVLELLAQLKEKVEDIDDLAGTGYVWRCFGPGGLDYGTCEPCEGLT